MGMLDGRVAIVTGGGRGIGRSHCVELAKHGAIVVVNDLGVALDGTADGERPADEVVAAIAVNGGVAVSDGTSVSDWAGVAGLIERTVARFGRLDIVVNNAGIVRDRMITSLSEDDFDAVINVHVKGTFTVTKHACDHWRAVAKAGGKISGRIINTTSGTGLFGNIGQSPYGAAKAAVANLTVVTAMEMERYSVTANAISPVAFTRMLATSSRTYERSSEGQWDPLDPGNSSPVVAWLASEDSGWLTGSVLRVEGSTVQRVRPWDLDPDGVFAAESGERLDAAEVGRGLRRVFGVAPKGLPPGRSTTTTRI